MLNDHAIAVATYNQSAECKCCILIKRNLFMDKI